MGLFSAVFIIVKFWSEPNNLTVTLIFVVMGSKTISKPEHKQIQQLLGIKWKELVKLMLPWKPRQAGNSYFWACEPLFHNVS